MDSQSAKNSNDRHTVFIQQLAIDLLDLNNLNEIIWKIISKLIENLGYEDCVIYLLDEKKKYLIKKSASDYRFEKGEKIARTISKIKLGDGVVGKVGISKKPLLINDTSLIDNYIVDEKRRHSELSVPIIYNYEFIGVIDSEHSNKNYFTKEDLLLFEQIASIAAPKIHHALHLEELYLKQYQMNLINESSNDIVFLISVEPNNTFRYLSVNQALLNILELNQADIIGKTLDDIWKKKKRDFFTAKYNEAIDSKQSISYEISLGKGDQVIAKTTITPIFDEYGFCTNISGISHNITENKQAGATLKESRDLFENLFEYSPFATFIHDFDNVINVNKEFLKLFKYDTKEDILTRSGLGKLVWPEDREKVIQTINGMRNKRYMLVPIVRLTKNDGSVFIAESHVSSVIIENKPHLYVSVRDITEAHEAEKTLLKSEKKYRTLFTNSLDGIYKSTPAGRFVDVNPALVKMLGYSSEEELLAIDIKTQLYFNIKDRQLMASHLEDQYPLKKKDGKPIWVEDHGYYEYDQKGEVKYHHGIFRDVTTRINEQHQLKKLLSVTADQNERLQNFAHIVSHNIRSHSSNMSSLVHFMEASKDVVEKEKLFGMLKTSTVKLEETIENLNEIITVNQNLQKPRLEKNLCGEVNNTLKVLSGDIRKNEINIIVDLSPNITVKVIPAYLDSILLNIISNAIKYHSDSKKCIININAIKIKEYTILQIKDNGLGIDMSKNAAKLFGMYQTFHDNKDSMGFGLYITKNQIEAMDGKIEVESEVNQGSTFKVYFKNEN